MVLRLKQNKSSYWHHPSPGWGPIKRPPSWCPSSHSSQSPLASRVMGTERAKEGTSEERVEVRTGPRPALPAPQQRAVDEFWRERQEEMEATVDFNDRILPMARLKRVIRAEEDGMMIAADTPAYLAKLCELFVQELAVRAWACAQSHHRRIILDSDIAEAAAYTESYDFLATVLLEHQREARLVGRAATPTTPPGTAARLITRKRHMPDPNPPRQVHGVRKIHPRALPITPSDVRYVPFPFPFPSAATGATATAEGLMILPPIDHATTGRAFFLDRNSGTSFAGDNSAAESETMASPPPPAGPAGAVALAGVHPAAYYLCAYPVTNDAEAFADGNTDPNVIPLEIVEGNVAVPPEIVEGNVADGSGDGGQQQKQNENFSGHHESVVVQRNSDVQDVGAGGAGGMFLEEILMDEGLMFPDAELFPLVGAPPDPEDFMIDQDVLDDVFANPSSSTSSD